MASRLERRLKDKAFAAAYEQQAILGDLLEAFADVMERAGVSRAELARRLKVTRAAVTRIFAGDRSPQLNTLVRVAQALDLRMEISLRPARECADPDVWVRGPRHRVATEYDIAWPANNNDRFFAVEEARMAA